MLSEPPQIRDPNTLAQDFCDRFEPWRAAANAWLAQKYGQANLLIVETFRTKARQDWLWMQGRVKGYGVFGKPVTWTMWTAHRLGLAVDVTPQVLSGRWVARWDLLDELFAAVPPEQYGLECIPGDLPHLQMAGMRAKTNVIYAQERGLVWGVEGSRVATAAVLRLEVIAFHPKGLYGLDPFKITVTYGAASGHRRPDGGAGVRDSRGYSLRRRGPHHGLDPSPSPGPTLGDAR